MKSYLNEISEINTNTPLTGSINIQLKSNNIIVFVISLDSFYEEIFYGTAHLWKYACLIRDNKLTIEESNCIGGAYYTIPERQINILEKFPKILDYIYNNLDKLCNNETNKFKVFYNKSCDDYMVEECI